MRHEPVSKAHFHYLLVRLCKRLADTAHGLYEYGDREHAEMGELLLQYGKLFVDIGWVLTQGGKELQDKVGIIVDEGFSRDDAYVLREDLVEWLSKRIGVEVEKAREENL